MKRTAIDRRSFCAASGLLLAGCAGTMTGTPSAAAAGLGGTGWLGGFVEAMKASGFVTQALKRHGIEGAAVAPRATLRQAEAAGVGRNSQRTSCVCSLSG